MKNIRSNFVKESLLDYENLAKTLKENTSSAVKDLLNEAVRETYAKLLSEEDENEYDEEEVDDTDSETSANTADDSAEDTTEEEAPSETDESGELEGELDGTEGGEEPIEGEEPQEGMEGSEDAGWEEFEKYKVPGSEDAYDFSQAEDEDIVKVYKLLKDDDEVLVNVDKDSNKVELKDNSTGAEYLLDLGSLGGGISDDEPLEDETNDMGAEGDLDYNEGMNEQRIFEIALNEYDSNVGYTDNYQSKDVMTNPGMSEPGKNVNDWDKGVPSGSEKPWSSKKGGKKEDQPFTAEKGKKVEEGIEAEEPMEEEVVNELKTVGEHGANDLSTSRTDGPNNPRKHKGRSFHTAQNGQETSTLDNPYTANESKVIAKANKIFKENKDLKKALGQFKNVLQEAAVTNKNLGQIIKLISENSTTKEEKMEIISRFGKEATSIKDSDRLYESINSELKKKSTMNINEDRQFTTSGSKMINETQIYQSKDLLDSLDLMHRLCK